MPKKHRDSTKGLVNFKNSDNECLRWAHIHHLNPQENHPERIKKIDCEFVKKLNYDGITFHVRLCDYKKSTNKTASTLMCSAVKNIVFSHLH